MKHQTIRDDSGRRIKLGIPDHADDEEMAALSAAVSALISAQETEEEEEEEEVDSWKMSGRYATVGERGKKTPKGLTASGWKLSSRADRF
ncbi:hypothetical protein ACEU6E_08600 [Halorutilales archaeon Cl-col2-1]